MKTENEFWAGLECMSSGEGLMADWAWAFGSTFELIKPFLRPTAKRSMSFPCPAKAGCDCRHEVREMASRLIACCTCGPDECEPFPIEPEDIVVHALDVKAFGLAVRDTLGFQEIAGAGYSSLWLHEVANYSAAAAPVYLSLGSSDALLREIGKVSALRDGPFVLLTPTGKACSQSVETTMRKVDGGHIALSSVLVAAGGRFEAKATIEPMLLGFERRVAAVRDRGAALRRIHDEIAAVRKDFGELRNAKQRLEKMLGEGMFAFTRKVDATSFKVLCTILAEGDVAKAGRKLGIGDPMMRYTLRQWRDRGGAYATMLDLVRWRKKVGRKEELPLNDAVLNERAETADYPGLLSDVLDGLLSMSDDNWQERCEELADLVRPAVK